MRKYLSWCNIRAATATQDALLRMHENAAYPVRGGKRRGVLHPTNSCHIMGIQAGEGKGETSHTKMHNLSGTHTPQTDACQHGTPSKLPTSPHACLLPGFPQSHEGHSPTPLRRVNTRTPSPPSLTARPPQAAPLTCILYTNHTPHADIPPRRLTRSHQNP